MTVYVMNALIIPIDFDKYKNATVKIRKATVEEVRQLLSNNEFVSAVGHEATAVLLTQLLGIKIQYNRITVKAGPGDILIHFVLKQRIPEGKVLTLDELQRLEFDLAISEVTEG